MDLYIQRLDVSNSANESGFKVGDLVTFVRPELYPSVIGTVFTIKSIHYGSLNIQDKIFNTYCLIFQENPLAFPAKDFKLYSSKENQKENGEIWEALQKLDEDKK